MYPTPERGESNTPDGAISLHNYGSTKNKNIDGGGDHQNEPLIVPHQSPQRSILNTFTSLKDVASKVAFLDSTKTHHHPPSPCSPQRTDVGASYNESPTPNSDEEAQPREESKVFFSHTNLRKLALDLSLWINIFILIIKVIAYLETLSLSILAALVDSILDVVSQVILAYTEKRSSKTRSSAHYPAGASRLEPLVSETLV